MTDRRSGRGCQEEEKRGEARYKKCTKQAEIG